MKGSGRRPQPVQQPPSKTARSTGGRQVYEAIRRRILTLELPPGAPLDEADLVRNFGVSRTPIREAIIRLASEELVVLLPNRGARVASISLTTVRAFFQALDLFQRAVNRWAAKHYEDLDLVALRAHQADFCEAVQNRDSDAMIEANFRFHDTIAQACANVYVASAYRSMLTEGTRLTRLAFQLNPKQGFRDGGYYATLQREHDEMIEALAAGDGDRAEALARAHTDIFRKRVIEAFGRDHEAEVAILAE